MSSFNRLLLGGSALALTLASAGSALAQSQAKPVAAESAAAVQEVVVTASRINKTGYDAPTPTTVLGQDDIERQAQPNIFQVITEMPSLLGSSGPQAANNTTSVPNTGLSAFAIHGLGQIRTLTLIDGQRVVPAYVNGVNDISQFPQLLIQRVDVVTGGASASYGSDAVGGVVNFITNKKFEGFKANILGGISRYQDNGELIGQAAWGRSFAGGRGHITVAGEYAYQEGVGPGDYGIGSDAGTGGRDFYNGAIILQRPLNGTPAGQPQFVYATGVQSTQLAKFGLITAGPLAGIAFGPGGTPYQFQFGNPVIGGFAVGGDTSANFGATTTLSAGLKRANFYNRTSFDVTDHLNVYTTLIASQVKSKNQPSAGAFRPGNLTIQCTNAFLPQSIVDACAANRITSFAYGTTNANLRRSAVLNDRQLYRAVVGADGDFDAFGRNWKFGSYAEYGYTYAGTQVQDILLLPYYTAAIDAVRGANGTIVCRSVVAQQQGCVPINIIGENPISDAALDWVYKFQPRQRAFQRQQVVAFTLNGDLFDLPAGTISIATGAEWRRESYSTKADRISDGGAQDPLLNPAGNNFLAGNFHGAAGAYNVREAFLEAAIPLINDEAAGKLDLSLAGRVTDYSTSGTVETWKAGLTYDTPIGGLKFRTLISRDIRAPNLSELFSANLVSNNVARNPWQNNAQNNIQLVQTGNANLTPEISTNKQIGVVFQPEWLPGFQASADYYRVKIKDGIGSVGYQTAIDLCFQGNTETCSAIITRTPGAYATEPFVQVIQQSFNLSSIKTEGLDLAASYRFEPGFVPGQITLQALATHVISFVTDTGVPGAIITDTAGQNSGALPDWKVHLVQTYSVGDWEFSITEDWISDGTINNTYIECAPGTCPAPTVANPTINNNKIKGALYVDLGARYKVNDNVQLYARVENVGNKLPPPSPATVPNALGINQGLYDAIGRMFRVGARLNY